MVIDNLQGSSGLYSLNIPNLKIFYLLKQIKNKGNIVYEYNPLRNYRFQKDGVIDYLGESVEKNAITDLDTPNFNFDLKHPVEIECQPSYDGSVNLILNDNLNPPKLINSRFTVRQNNTYEIVDRAGSNDTNLYDDSQFDLDTSLYKRVNEIPKITFVGLAHGGNLKVGNYNFYFKYCDADGNETDFVGESGIVVCHIGNINDPRSIRGGMENENSNKIVQFTLTNVDSAYDYVTVYYTRKTSSADHEPITEVYRLNRKFKVKGQSCLITIDGFEDITALSLEDINIKYFIAESAKTQAKCQNRLFLGNLNSPSIDYQDFTDLSLRMLPYYEKEDSSQVIGNLDHKYKDVGNSDTGYEYYNVQNIYNKLGYWNEEIYRLGVVYILNDDSLSPVFNIRGVNDLPYVSDSFTWTNIDLKDAYGNRNYLSYDETTYAVGDSSGLKLENAKGVIRINDKNSTTLQVYSIKVKVPTEVVEYIKELGQVKGFFFVRQKRIPTILAQAFTMGHDNLSGLPLINYGSEKDKRYLAESFIDTQAKLDGSYQDRLFAVPDRLTTNECAICPEYELRQPYFNNFFTDTAFVIKEPSTQLATVPLSINRDIYEDRHYYNCQYVASENQAWDKIDIISVADNITAKRNEINLYSSRAGNAEMVNDFKYVGTEFTIDYDKKQSVLNTLKGEKKAYQNNIVRGAFGPYIGITGYQGNANKLINIYIPGYSLGDMDNYFQIRYEDSSPYFAISDRISLKSFNDSHVQVYRGDCFICNFTHRLNRNFQDTAAPNADIIVDENCWKDNYKPTKSPEDMNKINIGDLNAVRLGSWITFKLCSNINLSMRDLDFSYPDEALLTGNQRTFYPLSEISTEGNYKIPESGIINTGISNTVSQRYNFTQSDVPYIKNSFQTRIAFSDISVNDAFKNGYRVFQASHFRDYPSTYGGLMKLVEVGDDLLAVFEHGVAIIPVNERVVAGEGQGGNVYINSRQVLPETMTVLSSSFGTQWPDSVIKTPSGVYGIDTVAKKIWRTNGTPGNQGSFQIISDFRVQEFLNQNITLSEREITPIIGVRNVKSHYNAFKGDVMFTFYDNLYGFEEKCWNLCYNENTQNFQTFYSWIPSYSENIDNMYFTFNRETSKHISKLGLANKISNSADGIVLRHPSDSKKPGVVFANGGDYAILELVERSLPNDDNSGLTYQVKYSLERDNFGNYKYFSISGNRLQFNKDTALLNSKKVWLLNIKAEIIIPDYTDTTLEAYATGWKEYQEINAGYYQCQIAITSQEVVNNMAVTPEDKLKPNLSTDFWKHGQSGIIDIKDPIKPCFWYGKQHPFEFEFVVNANIDTHKIFDNLQIISNKAAPESFHYEIVGDSYAFADDKKNMYIRQEFTKDLYQWNGSNILYNRNALEMVPEQRPIIGWGTVTEHKDKSTLFPLYYARQSTFDEVEDSYKQMTAPNKDYNHLAGGEIIYYPTLNEYRIWNHTKAVDIKTSGGRLRGNMDYQEDKWRIQINPLNLIEKNEVWKGEHRIPLALGNSPVPNDLLNKNISEKDIPQDLRNLGYTLDDLDVSNWNTFPVKQDNGKIVYASANNRKEVKLKDKYIKIRIRYTGNDLAIIGGVRTLFRTV